jgi:hypothetical protein
MQRSWRAPVNECVSWCVCQAGNRWSDEDSFAVEVGDVGPTVRQFHEVYGEIWVVSYRGMDALEEWARIEV